MNKDNHPEKSESETSEDSTKDPNTAPVDQVDSGAPEAEKAEETSGDSPAAANDANEESTASEEKPEQPEAAAETAEPSEEVASGNEPAEAADDEKTQPSEEPAAEEAGPDPEPVTETAADPEPVAEVKDETTSEENSGEEKPEEAAAPVETQETDSKETSPEPVAKDEQVATEEPAADSESKQDEQAAKPEEGAEKAASETAGDEEEGNQEKSFEELLEQYDKFRSYRPGDIVKGTVVSMGEQEVLLDIGARVEGMIPTTELKDSEGKYKVNDGDSITVMVCRFNPDAQYIPLSYERARVSRVWDDIEESAEKNMVLQGTVIEKVKGGFIVDVGVRAFLPTSQATLKPQKDFQDILGKKLEFSILKIQRRRGNLILSRRDLLQAEYEENKKVLFEKLKEGAVLDGVVKNITDYGVFIDLGGLDGLLHITDMSWGRVSHPKDMVELNQELKVKVLRFDPEKEKVSLGLKQCTADPWLSVGEKYPPETTASGKVLNLTSYGAFVELEPGVEGMIHVSEMSWTKKIRNPGQVLSKGQEVSARVLDLDTENRRVSLSLKQTEDNPWDSLAERFPVGSKVKGKVRNITEFGAFVEIEDGIDGLVHVSDFHWGERNANPTDYVKKGEEVEVVILAVDTDHRKVSLGIKQLAQDPWIEFTKKFKVNHVLTAPISKITDFGMFLKLSEHVEGLVRQAELKGEKDTKYEEGQEIQVMITRISHRDRKVDLSIRKVQQHQERQAVLEYTKQNDSGGATMGDVMSELRKFVK